MKNNSEGYYRVVITTDNFGYEVEDWVSFVDYDDVIDFCDNHQVGQRFYNYTIVDIRVEFIRPIL